MLVELPPKLRGTIQIRRGSFVVVDGAALAGRANKLGGEIVGIVLDVREWRRMGYWPEGFGKVGWDGGRVVGKEEDGREVEEVVVEEEEVEDEEVDEEGVERKEGADGEGMEEEVVEEEEEEEEEEVEEEGVEGNEVEEETVEEEEEEEGEDEEVEEVEKERRRGPGSKAREKVKGSGAR